MEKLWQAGLTLMFVSIAATGLANRSDSPWISYALMAGIAAGAVIMVAALFVKDEKDDGTPPAPPPGRSCGDTEEPRRELLDTAEEEASVPSGVYLFGGLLAGAGVLLFFIAPDGINALTRLSALLFVGGVLFICGAYVAYSKPALKRNFFRNVGAIIGFLLIFAAFMTGVLMAAGAMEPPELPYYGAGAVVALLAGMALFYYGLRYQQSAEGMAAGKALGFSDADGQVSGDGIYDAKGLCCGVETLIDVDQQPYYRGNPAHFTFTVLCRCPNSAGLRFTVKPSGFGSFFPSFSGLSPVEGLKYWEFYDVRSNMPEVLAKPLTELRAGDKVFGEAYGFKSMKLDKDGLEFVFYREGYIDGVYAKTVVPAAAAFAAKFN